MTEAEAGEGRGKRKASHAICICLCLRMWRLAPEPFFMPISRSNCDGLLLTLCPPPTLHFPPRRQPWPPPTTFHSLNSKFKHTFGSTADCEILFVCHCCCTEPRPPTHSATRPLSSSQRATSQRPIPSELHSHSTLAHTSLLEDLSGTQIALWAKLNQFFLSSFSFLFCFWRDSFRCASLGGARDAIQCDAMGWDRSRVDPNAFRRG